MKLVVATDEAKRPSVLVQFQRTRVNSMDENTVRTSVLAMLSALASLQ